MSKAKFIRNSILFFVTAFIMSSCDFKKIKGDEAFLFENRTFAFNDDKPENYQWIANYDELIVEGDSNKQNEINVSILSALFDSFFWEEGDNVGIDLSYAKNSTEVFKLVRDYEYDWAKELSERVEPIRLSYDIKKYALEKNIVTYECLYKADYASLANPYSEKMYINVDIESRKPIDIYDLVEADNIEQLKEAIYDDIVRDGINKQLVDISKEEFCDYSKLNNFYFDEYGITFFYNRGEISAKSKGDVEITILFEKIKTLLKGNNPIEKLYK